MFEYEKLEAWQDAVSFADTVYSITKEIPRLGNAEFIDTLRNAAVSVASNLAEGSSKPLLKDLVLHLDSSSMAVREVVAMAHLGRKRELMSPENFMFLFTAAEDQIAVLDGLRRSLQEGTDAP